MLRCHKFLISLAIPLLLVTLPGTSRAAGDPEGDTGRTQKTEAIAHSFMIAAAHPLAAKAGEAVLAEGGSAADAAIATQLVLGLVEPQSSGIGGGGFLVYFDKASGGITVYDGRETAPASDNSDLFLGPDGQPMRFVDALVGGRSVGVPGIVRLLEAVHHDHGKLPWAKLFQPAIDLADKGFAVTPRLHGLLEQFKPFLIPSPSIRARFYNPDGTPLAVGQPYRNADYAQTLRAIASGGADAFYQGPIAQHMVDAVHQAMDLSGKPNPGGLSLDDLKSYKILRRDALCGAYRAYQICGAGPPSAGTVGVLEILGMLQHFDIGAMKPEDPRAYHLFAEASRRAFADRDTYLGDPAFVDVPVKGLIDPSYLASRAATIDPEKVAALNVPAGDPPGRHAEIAPGISPELPGTSHMSIFDKDGNAIAFTTTVESPFGSHQMVDGFILNNQLTDFSFRPVRDGKPAANAVAPGKRPRSSMAPLIVLDAAHRPRLLIGSPGGSKIIDYVALATLAHLDWGLSIQAAIDHGNVVNTGSVTELEPGTAVADFAQALTARGHQVQLSAEVSGLHALAVLPDGIHGAADSRREGVALGE